MLLRRHREQLEKTEVKEQPKKAEEKPKKAKPSEK